MKNKALVLSLIAVSVFSIVSCGSNNPSGCDPDDTFCDDDTKPTDTITLDEDKSGSYNLDSSITNVEGSCNYEIFIRSFYDSDGDGIGDINGITEKLPYLYQLGVKNLWLMPFNPSPSYHGYDIDDYYTINSDYGTMDDFDNLVKVAKTYNIGVIMDLVINHCSYKNQWFIDSYNDYITNNTSATSKKDWFNWSNNSKSGYNRYDNSNVYYESRFSCTMPDFNLDNEDVRSEIAKICKFWLDKGVVGYRLDAVLYYYCGNDNDNIKFLKWLKETCESYKKDCYIVGECWTGQNIINNYYESTTDSFFSFPASLASSGNGSIVSAVKGITNAKSFGDYIENQEKAMKSINPNALSSYFLSNHDMDRSSNNLSNYYAKCAASLTYLLPGTPYIYYGEEIGLLGVRKTSPDDQSDVRRRLPMIWSKSNKTGQCKFPESNRTDLDNSSQVSDGVEDLLTNNYSLTSHYEKALNLRNKYSFIKDGIFTNLTSLIDSQNKHVLVYKITNGDNAIIIVHNFSSINVKFNVSSVSNKILDEINTMKKIPTLVDGNLSLGGYSSVILNVQN